MQFGFGLSIPLIASRGGNETPAQVLELETGDELLTEDGGLILLES
jgi:hypothetical protein